MCSICGTSSKQYLCKKCEKKLNQMKIFSAPEHLKSAPEGYFFDEKIHAFMYEGIVRELILQYKFNHKPYIYRTFKTFFQNNEKLYLLFRNYDIIVPVPISKRRWKDRGYNQSTLLTKELAKIFDLEHEENVIIKTKNNLTQSTLGKEDRLLNAKNVYKIKDNTNIKNKNILLVDDIFTTGATCNECAKVLKEAGAKKVGIFTIAKD